MQFTMPFDWNTTRLEQNKVLVHEEVTVPKPSEFAAKRSYVGSVNGLDVTKNVVLDDTDPQKDVIHFMLPKPEVIKIAEHVNNNNTGQAASPNELMQFTLQPGGGGGGSGIAAAAATTTSNNTTSTTTSPPMEKLTDSGTYKVKMSYSPANIQPTNTTTFNIEFLDPKSNQKKVDNVQYDFMIMPAEDPETMITHRAAKIAQNGSAQQSFTFTDENVGSVIARVANINNTGELVDFPITVKPAAAAATITNSTANNANNTTTSGNQTQK
jgi:hypothetical protein